MIYLTVNVYENRADFTFDPAAVLQRLEETFPGTQVDPGDQLELRARNAQAKYDDPSPAMRTVIETMWRDAKLQGPAYSFAIPCRTAGTVKGVVKRHLVQIGLDDPIDDRLFDRVKAFLTSIMPNSLLVEVEQH